MAPDENNIHRISESCKFSQLPNPPKNTSSVVAFSYLKRGHLLINWCFLLCFCSFFSHLFPFKKPVTIKMTLEILSFVIEYQEHSWNLTDLETKTLQVPKAEELDGMLHKLLQLRLFQLPGPTFLATAETPRFGGCKKKGGEDMGIYSGTQKPYMFFRRQKLI